MNAAKIIGHSYDAGIYCLACSEYDENLSDEPEDSEGNPVHPIFAGSEDADDECHECGCNLLTGEVPDSKEDVEEWARADAAEEAARQEKLFPTPQPCKHGAIDFAQSEPDNKGIMIHVTCRACGVSGSYPIDHDDITWPEED